MVSNDFARHIYGILEQGPVIEVADACVSALAELQPSSSYVQKECGLWLYRPSIITRKTPRLIEMANLGVPAVDTLDRLFIQFNMSFTPQERKKMISGLMSVLTSYGYVDQELLISAYQTIDSKDDKHTFLSGLHEYSGGCYIVSKFGFQLVKDLDDFLVVPICNILDRLHMLLPEVQDDLIEIHKSGVLSDGKNKVLYDAMVRCGYLGNSNWK